MSRNEILSPSLLRMDGRRPFELRSMEMHFSPHLSASHATAAASASSSSLYASSSASTLEQPDGSARLVQGLNDVTCCVFGPRDGSGGGGGGGGGDGASIEFEVLNENASQVGQERRANRSRNDRRTQDLTTTLTSLFTPLLSLHLYPRTSSILVSLLITTSDGSLLSTLINASTLALVTAGVPMRDYCLSTTLAFHPPLRSMGDVILVDPTSTEENDLPNLTVAVTPRDGQVALSVLEAGRGKVQGERVAEGLKVGVKVVGGVMLEEVEVAVKGWARGLRDAGLRERRSG